jgi:hypothetical protein
MKFLLLKTLLLQKQKDRGFTLPIVMAIGIVMVLLSAVNLVQSGEENLNAISQRGSADALAVAELGIARYRELLNNNRALAVYNLDQWTTLDDQTCEPISASGSGWANDDNDGSGSGYKENMWRIIEADETLTGTDLNNDGDATDDDAEIGRYKIVNYTYDNTLNPIDNGVLDLTSDAANNADGIPPTGTLIVQGRDRIGSIAQLQVTIPIGINTQELEDLDPALWIEQSTPTNIGNVEIDSDGDGIVEETIANESNTDNGRIVLYRPSTSGPDACKTPTTDVSDEVATSDPRKLPPLVKIDEIPTGSKRQLNSNISTNTGGTAVNFFTANRIVLGNKLDGYSEEDDENLDGDNNISTPSIATPAFYATNDRYYYYTDSDTTLNVGEAIIADGTSKVILHIKGKLTINTGSAGQRTRLVNSSHRTEVNPTASIDEIRATTPSDIGRYLEIHVDGDVDVIGSGELFITGLLRVKGKMKISSGSTVEVKGSIWTGELDNSGTINITTDDYKFFSITPNRTPAPLTFRPSQWERQEAKNF